MSFANKVYLTSDIKTSGNYVIGGNLSVAGNVMGALSEVAITKGTYDGNSTNQLGQFIQVEDARKWTITGTTGNDEIRLGDGGGIIDVSGGQDTVYGGSGKDTIKFDKTGNTTVGYYTYGQDRLVLDGAANVNAFNFAHGSITAGTTGNGILFTPSTNGINKVTVGDNETAIANDVNVWYTSGDKAVYMNASAAGATENIYMKGQVGKADTLIGGAGKDAIQAFDGQTVWGGAGVDKITLNGGNHVVGFAANSGVDTVTGFGTGFAKGNDSIWLFENSINDVKADYAKGNLVVSLGNDKTIFQNADSATGNEVQFLVKSGNTTSKVWLGATGNDQMFTVSTGNDADYYLGTKANSSTINFAQIETGLTIDMAHTGQFVDNRVYQNINNVIGGQGSDTIIGATDSANVLDGVDGADHIWGKGEKSDTLYGGTGKDTFYFGAGDGKDFVMDYSMGNDTVNLHSLVGLDGARAGRDANGNAYVQIAGTSDVLTFAGGSANKLDLDVTDAAGTKSKVVIGEVANATFTTFDGKLADIYIGNKGNDNTLDLASTDQAYNIDLRNAGQYINVQNIKGGTVSSTLIGAADAASKITAGTAGDSLYGGSKHNDTLVGADGADAFFFDAGDGNDLVQGYDQTKGDTIKFWASNTGVGVNRTSTGNVVLSVGADTLTLDKGGSMATALRVDAVMADGTKTSALIAADGADRNLDFTSGVNAYYGGNKVDTLTVSGIDNAEIWLDNRSTTFYTSIEKIDATNATGDVILAGGADTNNTIIGGKGSSSLWGGSGAGNDVLMGGTGTDVFYYGMDEGNDTIQDGSSMDKVMIYSPNFAVKSTELKSGSLIITTANDNTLTVKNWDATGLNTFELADGTKWGYDSEKKEWAKK